jgi:hypothetical protein
MKLLGILSLLISVVVGVTTYGNPSVQATTGATIGSTTVGAPEPVTQAAGTVVNQLDPQSQANAEAIRQWNERTKPAQAGQP